MYKGWLCGYEYSVTEVAGVFYILAKNYKEAEDLAQQYLTEAGLWSRVGHSNMSITGVNYIPANVEIIF